VQRVIRTVWCVWIDKKPAILFCVPCDRQHLHATAVQFGQVLLERPNTNYVPDLELCPVAAGPFGFDEEFIAPVVHLRYHAVVFELCVVEVSQHKFGSRQVHRQVVIRTFPFFCLSRVTHDARLSADVMGRPSFRQGVPPVHCGPKQQK